jgi:spore coat polysaccharide biosynthesis protein SpsF
MTRKLIAAYACRVQGSRLYGKPMQNLGASHTILDHLIIATKECPEIAEIGLGISEGQENTPFVETAKQHGVNYIIGDQLDVMWRLIQCGRAAAATDVFRLTTESPFPAWEYLSDLWRRHQKNDNEISVLDCVADGQHLEIYSLDALERCHQEGQDGDRSEYVSGYPRQNQHRFKIEIIRPPEGLRRMDLRLTVDYPEDLVICRKIYEALKDSGPRIPVQDIYEYLDANQDLKNLVVSYVEAEPIWYNVPQRSPSNV